MKIKFRQLSLFSFFIFLFALVVIAGCTASQTNEKAVPNDKVEKFTIEAKNWEFTPDTIKVSLGSKVKIKLIGLDDGTGAGHGLAIPEYGINVGLREGETKEIEFVADKKGTFPMFCSVYCGSGHGDMKGKFIVE